MAAATAVAMMRVTAACVATSMLQVDRDIGIPSMSADRVNERAASIDLLWCSNCVCINRITASILI